MNLPHGSSVSREKREEHSLKHRKRYSSIPLKEPFRPHWKRDYIDDVKNFLRYTDRTTPCATNKELLELIP